MNSEKGISAEADRPLHGDGMGVLYGRYTTNSALANLNLDETLDWSTAYFKGNFAGYLPPSRSARILEIGCGYGKNLLILQALGYVNTYGIDLSAEQIDYAREKLGLSQVENADALNWLQQAEGKFDCILLIDVLEHLDLDALMRLGQLMHEKLAPGGRVIVQVPNDLSPFNPYRQGDLTHLRSFTPQSLQQFFSSIDLAILGVHSAWPARRRFGLIRFLLWRALFNPFFFLLFLLLHGRPSCPLVFTGNVIAIAQKG